MTILSTASRGALRAHAASRSLVNRSNVGATSVGAKRFMGGGDHGDHDEHLTFHPPYNKGTVAGLVLFCVLGGSGTMVYGFVHQQYKQGYWK